MNFIRTSINNLDIADYNNIAELNLKFAKARHIKTFPIEKYCNIVKEQDGSYIIYGNLNTTYIKNNFDLFKMTECYINNHGTVLKNRYGNYE